ncbi:hypothetical protein OG426_06380 [Streptomyces canus]|uniref:hypothetical protein n=1 Tax=Streptomyces canus TaxID=58343 RepID=UPI002251F863|nr:hypothetical protein [Streptomyces canus]MCX4852661.1 hypothetical protein [Streptomyces canus]WSW32139.1 hypothetical protein OG426_06380 [Streptomyces canus]
MPNASYSDRGTHAVPPMQITVAVEAADGEAEETDALTRGLQEELLLVDAAESVVRPEAGAAPPGSKSGTVTALGALLVTGVFSRAALTAFVSLVGEWRQRAQARRVELTVGDDTLIVEGVSAKDQKALIEEWLQRRSGGNDPQP